MKIFIGLVKNNYLLLLIFFFALLLRLYISPLGFHDDIFSQAGWGQWIFTNGTLGFYENREWVYSWPTQLPITSLLYGFSFWLYDQLNWIFTQISYAIAIYRLVPTYMLWWFDFVKWFSSEQYSATGFKIGSLIIIKLFAITSDLIIAAILYLFARRLKAESPLIFPIVYLFLPFGWYLSGLWGQYDQLAALLTLLSFVFLYKRLFYVSAILLFVAGNIKPTVGYFLPLYMVYFFLQRPAIKNIVFGAFGILGIFWITTSPFSENNPIFYIYNDLLPKVLFEGRWRITTHAFNFWAIFFPINTMSAASSFLFLPASLWGNIALIVFYIWSILLIWQKNNFKNVATGLYLIAAGSYIFSTGMLDRYFFSAILFLGILSIYYRKLFKWWIIASLLFSFNLYYSWGFPFLEKNHAWSNPWIISICSILQVLVFLICLKNLHLYEYIIENILKFRRFRTIRLDVLHRPK